MVPGRRRSCRWILDHDWGRSGDTRVSIPARSEGEEATTRVYLDPDDVAFIQQDFEIVYAGLAEGEDADPQSFYLGNAVTWRDLQIQADLERSTLSELRKEFLEVVRSSGTRIRLSACRIHPVRRVDGRTGGLRGPSKMSIRRSCLRIPRWTPSRRQHASICCRRSRNDSQWW